MGNEYRVKALGVYPAILRIVICLGMGKGYRVKCTGSLYPEVQRIVVWRRMDNGYHVKNWGVCIRQYYRESWSGWEWVHVMGIV